MILKIRKIIEVEGSNAFKQEDIIFGSVANIKSEAIKFQYEPPGCVDDTVGINYDYDFRCPTERNPYFRRLYVTFENGESAWMAYDCVAWLMNDNGKTIEAFTFNV